MSAEGVVFLACLGIFIYIYIKYSELNVWVTFSGEGKAGRRLVLHASSAGNTTPQGGYRSF